METKQKQKRFYIVYWVFVSLVALVLILNFAFNESEYRKRISRIQPRSEETTTLPDSSDGKQYLTPHTLSEDYRIYYDWYLAINTRVTYILITIGAAYLIAACLFALFKLIHARISKEGQSRHYILTIFLFLMLPLVILAGYILFDSLRSPSGSSEPPPPKEAQFSVYVMDFHTKYLQHHHRHSDNYVNYSVDGVSQARQVSSDLYLIFPNKAGTYYVAVVSGENYSSEYWFYPESEYVPSPELGI